MQIRLGVVDRWDRHVAPSGQPIPAILTCTTAQSNKQAVADRNHQTTMISRSRSELDETLLQTRGPASDVKSSDLACFVEGFDLLGCGTKEARTSGTEPNAEDERSQGRNKRRIVQISQQIC